MSGGERSSAARLEWIPCEHHDRNGLLFRRRRNGEDRRHKLRTKAEHKMGGECAHRTMDEMATDRSGCAARVRR